MESKDFFDTLASMRGYQGDTFPAFCVVTDADDLTGCSMRLVLEDISAAGSAAMVRACEAFEEEQEDGTVIRGFQIQLSTEDTAVLCGTYKLHFILTDTAGNEQRKLIGMLTVLDSPEEV